MGKTFDIDEMKPLCWQKDGKIFNLDFTYATSKQNKWEKGPGKKIITLLRVIPTMTFQNNHVRFYVSLIGSGELRFF